MRRGAIRRLIAGGIVRSQDLVLYFLVSASACPPLPSCDHCKRYDMILERLFLLSKMYVHRRGEYRVSCT